MKVTGLVACGAGLGQPAGMADTDSYVADAVVPPTANRMARKARRRIDAIQSQPAHGSARFERLTPGRLASGGVR